MTSPARARSIWLVGDATRPEFQPAARWLAQVARVTPFTTLRSATANGTHTHNPPAERDGMSAEFPDWIVLLTGHPGEFSQAAVRRLQAARPLARPIGLFGSWCEGELRTGQPWPGVARVLWHQWEPRLKRQWQLLTTGQAGSWALPRTTQLTEELLFDLPARGEPTLPRQPSTHTGVITIHAGPAANAESLADGCRAAGYRVAPQPNLLAAPDPRPAIDVAIWDAPGWRRDEWSDLASFVSHMHPTPVLAVISAPRHDDVAAAQAHGAAAVLGKPFQIHDLWWWLDELRRPPVPSSNAPPPGYDRGE